LDINDIEDMITAGSHTCSTHRAIIFVRLAAFGNAIARTDSSKWRSMNRDHSSQSALIQPRRHSRSLWSHNSREWHAVRACWRQSGSSDFGPISRPLRRYTGDLVVKLSGWRNKITEECEDGLSTERSAARIARRDSRAPAASTFPATFCFSNPRGGCLCDAVTRPIPHDHFSDAIHLPFVYPSRAPCTWFLSTCVRSLPSRGEDREGWIARHASFLSSRCGFPRRWGYNWWARGGAIPRGTFLPLVPSPFAPPRLRCRLASVFRVVGSQTFRLAGRLRRRIVNPLTIYVRIPA